MSSMLDKSWISGIPSDEQERYKPVTKCTYLQVLGSLNNCNIIQLSQKSTPFDAFDEIHQVFIDDLFQPKTSTCSTLALIQMHFKTVHQFSQPIFSLFSHLKNTLHNLVISLCSTLKYSKYIQRLFIKFTHSLQVIIY